MTAIYLAGRIGKGDWRHDLVKGLRGAVYSDGYQDVPRKPTWPVLNGAIGGWADYTGPYALSCDHGCFHGVERVEKIPDAPHMVSGNVSRDSAHGVSAGGRNGCSGQGIPRDQLVTLCRGAIMRTTVVFAWVDEPTCYGTLCEVGFAVGRAIEVVTASSAVEHSFTQDMWFVRELSNDHITAPNPVAAFKIFAQRHRKTALLGAVESPIEKMFLEAVLKSAPPELADLRVAHKVAGRYRLDFALPEVKLGVELDGYEYHSSKEAFTQDRRRERELRSMGWDIIRFSGSEIHHDVNQCVTETVARARSIGRHMERPFDGPAAAEVVAAAFPGSTVTNTGAAAEARRRLQARNHVD